MWDSKLRAATKMGRSLCCEKLRLKRGNITAQGEETIVKLHSALGNKWSSIAAQLPGRTDNEIKNYWNSHLRRRIYNFAKTTKDTATKPTAAIDAITTTTTTTGGESKPKSGRTSLPAMHSKAEAGEVLGPREWLENEIKRLAASAVQIEGVLEPSRRINGGLSLTANGENDEERTLMGSKKMMMEREKGHGIQIRSDHYE